MASGFVVSSQARVTSNFAVASISRVLSTKCRNSLISSQLCSSRAPSNRFFCECSHLQDPIDLIKYKEVFSRRMAMAGLKPHHRIALGVSGGPDSMALCILTADWKTNGLNTAGESRGFIDGLLAIIVDHGLRAESKDEANIVRHRVSDMGIRCEIAQCDWLDGKPKQGHLQEAAREMRYQIFQNVCIQHQIGVLLVAHHADDQAELFILRLSRDSGVLGLAGMAFASQLFSTYTNYFDEASDNYSILLVRPLLEFSKEDLYKICEGGNQEWVEDPTNQNPSFARNRIRLSLRNLPSCTFKYELQAVISACRKTRAYVDQICSNLINEAASVMAQGYAVIDLEILHPSKIEDICLSKFIALVLQFISQRHRPVRGSTSKLLLDYIRTFPCKTSLTAAGCYLCAAPRSKDVQFLDVASSESILVEAKRRNILSESTYSNILSLQEDETKHFKSKTKTISDHDLKMHGVHTVSTSLSLPLQPGQICYFMNRFLVSWNLSNKISGDKSPVEEASCNRDLAGKSLHHFCRHCMVGHDMVAEVRHMVDADWLYLAKLSKHQNLENHEKERVILASAMEQISEKTILCSDFARLSAERALHSLKSIPVAARRSLPVLINSHGLLLSIPSICFRHCPYLMVSAVFKPRVPLGGGHSSFL
ncbi:tRNA(Ile)-lysidine synthase isoform X3 [Vitis riparia]|uniref:tRNA(Ile)-lysidine synthase isoform X3 n=1 Tax=Vitis riparia TaxID=96939 RepID=UPI00155AE8F4|nr:tRNA(Ile)-lysidine synthase isoform X3 [Vitis riparia]